MIKEIKMLKLVTGETVVGKYNPEDNSLEEVAFFQHVPAKDGMQMMLFPYGYPFVQALDAKISLQHVIFTYNSFPADIIDRYLELCEKATLQNAQSVQSPSKD